MMNMSKIALAAVALAASTSAYAFPIAAPGTEGFLVIAGGGDIIATYEGNSAAYSNDLYLNNTGQFIFNNHASAVGSQVNLGSFAAGTELIFRMFVNNTGFNYLTGPAQRNPDGHTHARVQDNWAPGTTLVSFEDLFDGPFDYNDLSFSFTNTRSAPSVPEASTWAMMLVGFGAIGAVMRRRSTKVSFA